MMNENDLNKGWKLAESLVRGLRSGEILPLTYPLLFRGGVTRGALHSYVLSALLLLGDRLGYSAVFDSPIFQSLDSVLTGEGAKRPDSIWFERGTEQVRVLIEFERYSSNSLERKAQNLILAARACDSELGLMALIYWIQENQAQSNLDPACEVFRKGFALGSSQFDPSTCPVLILETLAVEQARERLTLLSFTARRFIFAGEDKPYVVDKINSARQ